METQTYRDLYGSAMEILDQDAADAIFEELVSYTIETGNLYREGAETLVRSNLGYYAGYYDNDTRERVERLFNCEHPVFGSIAENGPPTMEAAFQAGVAMAQNAGGDQL